MKRYHIASILAFFLVAALMVSGCGGAKSSSSHSLAVTSTTTAPPPLTLDEKIQIQAILQMLKSDTGFSESHMFDTLYLDSRTRDTLIGGYSDGPLPKRRVSDNVFRSLRKELQMHVIPTVDRREVTDRSGTVLGNGAYVTVTVVVNHNGRTYVGTTIYRSSEDATYMTYEVKQTEPEIILLLVSSAMS